ncbi:MAG: hypothetical protein WCY88_12595 [Spongiibacteraceae bacterium]
MTDTAEDDSSISAEDRVSGVSRKSILTMVLISICLVMMLVVFVVGLMSLVSAHKATTVLEDKNPDKKIAAMVEKIEDVKEQVGQQYDVHLSKINDGSILGANKKFKQLYQISLASEQDYLAFMTAYQKIDYEVASRVRGSGEWYFYHGKGIETLVANANKRKAALAEYLSVE